MKKNDTLIIIPAYNEQEFIGDVINETRKYYPETDVLVIDDNSGDKTVSIAEASGCLVLRHAINLGDGASRHTGFLYALKAGYEYVVQIDADGQHVPSYIHSLLQPLRDNKADIAIGSRFLVRSRYKNTFLKNIGVFVFSRIASFLTGVKITDTTSGFRAVNRKVLESYAIHGFYPSRFPDADLIINSHRAGFRIKEIPVEMKENRKAVPLHHGFGIIYYVFKIFLSIIVTLLRENPAKGGINEN